MVRLTSHGGIVFQTHHEDVSTQINHDKKKIFTKKKLFLHST